MTQFNYLRKTITVETEQYRTITLRPMLSVGDTIDLSQTISSIEERELAAEIVSRIMLSPALDIEEILSWNDELLVKVVLTWAEEGRGWELSGQLPPFQAFKERLTDELEAEFEQMKRSLVKAQITIQQALQPLIQAQEQIQRTLVEFTEAIQPIQFHFEGVLSSLANVSGLIRIKADKFFENLPDFHEIAKRLESHRTVIDTLEKQGFRFLLAEWPPDDIDLLIIKVARVEPQVRGAAATNRLLRITRDAQFADELRSLFQNSSILRRRWPIIEQAIATHMNRHYHVSVPVLIAQGEGIFTDALVLRNIAIKSNGKFFAKDSNTGQQKLNRKRKPIELHGLGQKVDNSDLQNEPLLQSLAEFYTSHLVPERNKILHGNHLSYGKAKLSTQLLLSIFLLSLAFNEYEGENQ